MLLSSLSLLLLAPIYAAASKASRHHPDDAFYESLTLHPLPDGRMSVLFQFETEFSSPRVLSSTSQSHHSLTPPSLILPLERNNVSELTISFTSGWDQQRSSSSGPLHYESSGGGGEIRGWLKDGDDVEDRWSAVTHALGGLFCAGLGPGDSGENVRTFGNIYPEKRRTSNTTHFLLSHPESHLCTENLTPFLSLLPSKGLSGISSLLAQPGIIFTWASQSEGIEVLMPTSSNDGVWRGWWEGIIDLVDNKGNRKRDFSIEGIFKKKIPKAFPETQQSILRLIKDDSTAITVHPSGKEKTDWIDGKLRDIVEWDLLDQDLIGGDININWDEEKFDYPRHIPPPPITITRTVIDKLASDGTFQITINNNEDIERKAVYSELWPWWVKGWMSEVELTVQGEKRPELIESISYNPSLPPKISTSTIHFNVIIPPKSKLILKIPFSKLTLRYTEHRPDAERGIELPSGILTLLDTIPESRHDPELESERRDSSVAGPDVSRKGNDARKTGRRRIYTNRLLLDVPTPDFSMPYNVIIMSSTVMAVFFGLMQGALTRKWGWVEVPIMKGESGTSSLMHGETKDNKVSVGADTSIVGGYEVVHESGEKDLSKVTIEQSNLVNGDAVT
ncbi:uncharacterized protein IL334_005654 [Kwoniella shivajii]|uniref:Phosphatidylinositol glycan, class T n=1 Tax=Kwoniella shivajii TaxID=564305 RepID=A0ABZ1D5L5_9TREE|nr:hypothetical protein IL334_005654 [Kwoniella shivajii]